MGKAAYLIDDASDIQEAWVKDAACVGVTAGASAPDILVQNVITRLQELGGGEAVPLEGREENIVFEVPKELRVDVREVELSSFLQQYEKMPDLTSGIFLGRNHALTNHS